MRANGQTIRSHLSCLYDCGLVLREQECRYVRYQLSDPRVGELLQIVNDLLAEVAHGVYACVRYESEGEGKQ